MYLIYLQSAVIGDRRVNSTLGDYCVIKEAGSVEHCVPQRHYVEKGVSSRVGTVCPAQSVHRPKGLRTQLLAQLPLFFFDAAHNDSLSSPC